MPFKGLFRISVFYRVWEYYSKDKNHMKKNMKWKLCASWGSGGQECRCPFY